MAKISILPKHLCLFLLVFVYVTSVVYATHDRKAITYEYGSRTGDNLLAYTHAKWLSYLYDVPLYYRPFEYSDQFVFHECERVLTDEIMDSYVIKRVRKCQEVAKPVRKKTLFVVDHFPDSYDEYVALGWQRSGIPYVDVDWGDVPFKEMMQRLIASRHDLDLICPPEGVITVALHYRSGEGFDSDEIKKIRRLCFLPDEYYFRQLRQLQSMMEAPLYVFIFTDHPYPETVVNIFREEFGDQIVFASREGSHGHDLFVIEDFFSMLKFDCLIRSISHFSTLASHLGDYKVMIYPKKIKDNGFKVYVTVTQRWNTASREWECCNKRTMEILN